MKLAVLPIAFALVAFAQAHSSIPCDGKSMILNKEYLHNNLANGIFIDVWEEQDCCELCRKDQKCNFWTFERVVSFPYGICALKFAPGELVGNRNAISGGMRVPTPAVVIATKPPVTTSKPEPKVTPPPTKSGKKSKAGFKM